MIKMQIDWAQLALNLRRYGSLESYSYKLGRGKGYLGQLSRGELEEPKFSDGLILLNLHLDVCGLEKHKRLIL